MSMRVLLTGNQTLIDMVGDSPPPLIGFPGASSPEAGIDILSKGNITDVFFCGYYITPKRALLVDPSPWLLNSGYSLVTSALPSPPDIIDLIGAMFPSISPRSGFSFLFWLFLTGIYANLMWLLEGGRKDSIQGAHINGGYARGFFDAWYMSICTGMTVGYGDKVPITFFGKLLTVIYAYASFYCIFSLFGSVASDMYSGSLRMYQTNIQTTADLEGLRVGSYFTQAQVTLSMVEPSLAPIKQYGDVNLAYQAMLTGEIDVLVDDTVSAYYRVGAKDYAGKLFVAGESFLPVPYGMYMSRPNGEMHPLYPHFYRAVIDYTQSIYRMSSQKTTSSWLSSSQPFQAMTKAHNDALEGGLLNASWTIATVLAVIVGLASLAGALHYRNERQQEANRRKLLERIGIDPHKFSRADLKKGVTALFEYYDVDESGTLELDEIVRMLLDTGFEKQGLVELVRQEAKMSGLVVAQSPELAKIESVETMLEIMDLPHFVEMISRIAVEGFNSTGSTDMSGARGHHLHKQELMLFLNDFHEQSSKLNSNLTAIESVLETALPHEPVRTSQSRAILRRSGRGTSSSSSDDVQYDDDDDDDDENVNQGEHGDWRGRQRETGEERTKWRRGSLSDRLPHAIRRRSLVSVASIRSGVGSSGGR